MFIVDERDHGAVALYAELLEEMGHSVVRPERMGRAAPYAWPLFSSAGRFRKFVRLVQPGDNERYGIGVPWWSIQCHHLIAIPRLSSEQVSRNRCDIWNALKALHRTKLQA